MVCLFFFNCLFFAILKAIYYFLQFSTVQVLLKVIVKFLSRLLFKKKILGCSKTLFATLISFPCKCVLTFTDVFIFSIRFYMKIFLWNRFITKQLDVLFILLLNPVH